MVPSVEEVSSSLVREYLSRKGLKRTIACMDEEHPRTGASINNRSQLRQILSIEDLYRKNKVQNSPLKTLLEIIVKHLIEQVDDEKIMGDESHSLQRAHTSSAAPAGTPTVVKDRKTEGSAPVFVTSKHTKSRFDITGMFPSQPTNTSLMPAKERKSSNDQTGFWGHTLEVQKDRPLMASLQDDKRLIQREPEKSTSISEIAQRSRSNRIRRGMLSGPIPQESNKKRHSRKVEVPQPLPRKEEENRRSQDGHLVTDLHQKSFESSVTESSSDDCVRERCEAPSVSERIQSKNNIEKVGLNVVKTTKAKTRPNLTDPDVSEMVLQNLTRTQLCWPPNGPTHCHVLLGSSLNCFSVEWRNQGFTFSDTHDLRYGIVQRKGGPCGVLASVQAFVLKKLLFENSESCNMGLQRLRPSNSTRRKCLVLALAEILWRAGEEKQATIAINSWENQFTPTRPYKSEGVLEKITCLTVDNIKDLELLLEQHVEQFETGMLGCMLLTISAILSRSIEKVREDMDVPTTTLIGAHGYCTQELVNLLLCGRAVSNVFDNDVELDSGNGNMTLLKGIKGHCDVGLLSLFEHYNICKVGGYLKTPQYPIWVVCSESHFSVLFGLQRELLTNEDSGPDFDLYYFDGLANQQEEIRLTVSVGKLTQSSHDVDTDLIPPLELCIRTRWKDAFVNWNDTEPIL
ncbi:probable ubiquitin carboxyl-terminal hydrolase MINDY-4 isoform X2 [Archocentrus centrarchus]|uniref:probable ubiquitin carboxyl-terminal hydrolase MINDY-4 isoform X2 n=1 Tax=Archocentrus centrarchus TaxID=63155 RepID=UPI0011EA5167|nr:probable ubiquitin carboxyl-terminal hydrolase MINDY-4 isoform X2 [Archocentrus centrarchus]